jgi:hypothetical protein
MKFRPFFVMVISLDFSNSKETSFNSFNEKYSKTKKLTVERTFNFLFIQKKIECFYCSDYNKNQLLEVRAQ